MPAEQLVPGDVIHIRMGDLLSADVQLLDGRLLLDQSALTGESLPVEAVGSGNGYTGTVVQHGEATAAFTATRALWAHCRTGALRQTSDQPGKGHLFDYQSAHPSGWRPGAGSDGVCAVGIAVSTATDVAKAAASLVLVQPGLTNILSAIQVSRRIYQRMLTYTLNKIIKTIQVAGFLSLGLILTGSFVTTPLLVILLIFANDFVTMSIASDQVHASSQPDRWDVRAMLIPALSLALPVLALTFGIFLTGRNLLHLPLGQLQTLSFITLVFTAQGMIYLVPERRHVWASLPGVMETMASTLDILVVILLASFGVLMQAIPLWLTLSTLGVVALALLGLDFFKVWLFQKV